MARSEAKRQKRLAKQKAKRDQKRQEHTRKQSMGLAEQLAQFETVPVADCLVSAALEENGLGYLCLSKKAPSGEMVAGVFLVDIYCMGVKDCFAVTNGSDYYRVLEGLREKQKLRSLDPPSAGRLIEDAVAYADSLGIPPHADFRRVKPILKGIDPAEARETFPMGKDGKPFFVAGPGESSQRRQQIIAMLHARCGPGGYHYITPVGDPNDIVPGERMIIVDDEAVDEEEM